MHRAYPQGGAEKLSDEDIEATLEKVIKLLAFISDKVLLQSCSSRLPPQPL